MSSPSRGSLFKILGIIALVVIVARAAMVLLDRSDAGDRTPPSRPESPQQESPAVACAAECSAMPVRAPGNGNERCAARCMRLRSVRPLADFGEAHQACATMCFIGLAVRDARAHDSDAGSVADASAPRSSGMDDCLDECIEARAAGKTFDPAAPRSDE